MANTFITPTVIAKRALATLYNNTVLLPLVLRDYDAEFTGKQGDTVTIRVPASFTAESFVRANGITIQTATETSDTIALDTIKDVSFEVNNEDMLLDVEDFATQLLNPAMEAISQSVDGDLAENLVDAAEGGGGGGTATWSSSTASTVFTGELGARSKLGRNKIPTTQRFAVFSPEGAGVCLTDSKFVEADKSGWTDSLREGSLGRLFGFDTYESQVFGYGTGDRAAADGVAFHREAVAFVSRSLGVPQGAAAGTVADANYKGLGLRVAKSYNITYKKDVISVDLLCGVKKLRPSAAVQLSFGLGS
jgi:hypothetical protein